MSGSPRPSSRPGAAPCSCSRRSRRRGCSARTSNAGLFGQAAPACVKRSASSRRPCLAAPAPTAALVGSRAWSADATRSFFVAVLKRRTRLVPGGLVAPIARLRRAIWIRSQTGPPETTPRWIWIAVAALAAVTVAKRGRGRVTYRSRACDGRDTGAVGSALPGGPACRRQPGGTRPVLPAAGPRPRQVAQSCAAARSRACAPVSSAALDWCHRGHDVLFVALAPPGTQPLWSNIHWSDRASWSRRLVAEAPRRVS